MRAQLSRGCDALYPFVAVTPDVFLLHVRVSGMRLRQALNTFLPTEAIGDSRHFDEGARRRILPAHEHFPD